MALQGVLIQVANYPRKAGESKSIIITGEDYREVYVRIEHLFKQLAQHEEITIQHLK